MSNSQGKKTDAALQQIYMNARSLYETFPTELKNGILPDGLSLQEIEAWQKQINCKYFSLKDRLSLYKHQEIETNKIKWIDVFEIIIKKYNLSAFKAYSSSNDILIKPFSLVIMPFVDYAKTELKSGGFNVEKYFTQDAFQAYLNSLIEMLSQFSSLAFAYDYKMQPNRDYNKYCKSFFKTYAFTFYESYSALARLLSEQTQIWIDATKEFLNNLEVDRDEISNTIFDNKSFGKIIAIKQDLGAAHSHLGPNRIITFTNNRKLVYKTKSAQNDKFYKHLIQWINATQAKTQFRAYRFIDKTAYSWHEYIANTSCKDEEEINEYYFKIGYLAALFQVLGSSDYHYGNIIAHRDQPVCIDHETILNFNQKERLFDLRNGHILDSKDPNYKMLSAFDFEIFLAVKKVVQSKPNTIRIIKRKKFWRGNNIPLLNRKRANPYLYKASIMDGYKHCLSHLLKCQSVFTEFLSNELQACDVSSRFLHRSSINYHMLLVHSCEPEYLKSGVSRSILFESLFQKIGLSKPDEFRLNVISKEIQSMEQYYVPRFVFEKQQVANMKMLNHARSITKKTYIKKQVLKNLDYLKRAQNMRKELNSLSKYLRSKM